MRAVWQSVRTEITLKVYSIKFTIPFQLACMKVQVEL